MPAPKNAPRVQPSDQSIAALFGWSRRPRQTMVKLKTTMAKKGAISRAPKMLPNHCQ